MLLYVITRQKRPNDANNLQHVVLLYVSASQQRQRIASSWLVEEPRAVQVGVLGRPMLGGSTVVVGADIVVRFSVRALRRLRRDLVATNTVGLIRDRLVGAIELLACSGLPDGKPVCAADATDSPWEPSPLICARKLHCEQTWQADTI